MDFEGRVIQYLGETSGTSKAGNLWKKKEWVVETFGPYPRKVKIQCFGERADNINLEPGKDYVLSVDLESREFNGRWYTDVSVFRVAESQGNHQTTFNNPQNQGNYPNPNQMGMQNAPYGNQGFAQTQSFTSTNEENEEDLPF